MRQFIFSLLFVFLVPMVVIADDDHERARLLKESGQILSLEQILKSAQSKYAGRVLEVELESKDGRYVYEIELLNKEGEVWELYFDASSGALIKRERDD